MFEENANGPEEDSLLAVEKLFLEKSTPTKEDLERVFTNEELTELCLKHKCRVDMWKYNIVYDYRAAFTEKGRWQRWSEKLRMRMLAYAVNLRKPEVLYDDKLIAEANKKEHEMQIKENILSLNYWKRLRKENEEEMNMQAPYRSDNTEDSESTRVNGIQQQVNDGSDDVVYISADMDSNDLEIQPQQSDPILSDNIENNLFDNVNTESMTINSLYSIQSQLEPSEDLLPHDYDNFNREMPLTSTQSQNAELQH